MRELERKASEGDAAASAALAAARARVRQPRYTEADGLIFTPNDERLREAARLGRPATMKLVRGDLCLVEKLDPHIDSNYFTGQWLGAVHQVYAGRSDARVAELLVVDLMDAQPSPLRNFAPIDVTAVDRIVVVRREGKPLL